MLCTNCGNPLLEGGRFCTKCGTPVEAPAAVQPETQPTTVADSSVQETPAETTSAASDWKQTLQTGAAQAAAKSKQLAKEAATVSKKLAQDAASSDLTKSSKGLIMKLLKNPADGLEVAWAAEDKKPQLVLAILYFVAWMLFPMILLCKLGVSFTAAFGYSLFLALPMCCTKVLHAGAYYLCSDKTKGFVASLALVFTGGLHESICLLLIALLSLFGLNAAILIAMLMVFMLMIGVIINCQAAMVIVGSKKVSYLVTVVTIVVAFVMLLFWTFTIMQIAIAVVNSVFGSLF